jgi:predicted aldo/keto reductase-like oxidoreductase
MQDRREFLQALAGLTAGLTFGELGWAEQGGAASDRLGELLPLRQFGGTNEQVTMLGLGGFHIGMGSDKSAQARIEAALEGGVRFFDNAEAYHGGESEHRYGRHLVRKYRDVSFIMTKTGARDADTARRHLEGSLRRMNLDTIDLWQMHSLTNEADAENRIENGVLDVMRQAQEEGKVRYIGFTGHRSYKAHQRMLELFPDTAAVQMPINAADPGNKSFIDNVLPQTLEQQAAPIAMKTLADGAFHGDRGGATGKNGRTLVPDVISLEQALRFAWSMPVSVSLTGTDTVEMLQEKIDLVRRFKRMAEADRKQVVADVNDALDELRIEYYKA